MALGLGGLALLLSIILASALLLAPGFREWVREEWHIRRLRSRDVWTRWDAASQLLDMRSERGLVRLLKEPLPELNFRWFYFGNYALQPTCRLIQEIGPRKLDRICRHAFERGDLTEAEILGFCNRSIPGWAEAMKALRVGEPPEELRSLEDLPQFIDRVGRFLEEVYG